MYEKHFYYKTNIPQTVHQDAITVRNTYQLVPREGCACWQAQHTCATARQRTFEFSQS